MGLSSYLVTVTDRGEVFLQLIAHKRFSNLLKQRRINPCKASQRGMYDEIPTSRPKEVGCCEMKGSLNVD